MNELNQLSQLDFNRLDLDTDMVEEFIGKTNNSLKSVNLKLKTIYVGDNEQDILNKIFAPQGLKDYSYQFTTFVNNEGDVIDIIHVDVKSHIGYGVV